MERATTKERDYTISKTCSLVVTMGIVMVVVALACVHKLQVHQMDVFNAFLQGD